MAKPLKFMGSSLDDLRNFPDEVYVLHAFQKKSRKTSREDIELARHRYKQIGGNL